MATAVPVTLEQAAQAVTGWRRMETQPLGTRLGGTVETIEPVYDGATVLGYVVYFQPAGFALAPADDWIEPILAFAASGRFNPAPTHPLGALAINDLRNRMDAARRRNAGAAAPDPASAAIRAKWRRLKLAGQTARAQRGMYPTVSDERVPPLTQTAWDQGNDGGGYCYNYFTPNHYVCGCGATAMAQLMRYYRHPSSAVGARVFTVHVDGQSQNRTLLGGDGRGGAYNWDNMPINPDAAMTEPQRQSIGALCHDAGAAAQASYTADATSTDVVRMGDTLNQVFGYAQVIQGFNDGDNIIGDMFYNMANPSLDAGCPCLLAIYDSGGGHAVVCDGYGYNAGTMYHHINMGWGASAAAANVWYALPTIDPYGMDFNTVLFCMYNIFPGFTGEIISGRVLDHSGLPISGATVRAVLTSGAIFTAQSNSRGIYALGPLPSDTFCTISAAAAGHVFADRTVSTGRSTTYTSVCGNRWGIDFNGQLNINGKFTPVARDYDGDGKIDAALYQSGTGLWGIRPSGSDGELVLFNFGSAGYIPIPADYDGDGKADPALYHDGMAHWTAMLSGRDYAIVTASLGMPSDGYDACPADYDGDGLADPAFYHDATAGWSGWLSGSGYAMAAATFGVPNAGCAPIPADFDGDGKTDPALYHEPSGYWGIMHSGNQYQPAYTLFGGPGWLPAPGDYNGDGCTDPAIYQIATGIWLTRTAHTPSALPAPADVTASCGVYTNKIRLTWSPVDTAAGYTIYRSTNTHSFMAAPLVDATNACYDDLGVTPDTRYYYWIKAWHTALTSDFSQAITGYASINGLECADLEMRGLAFWPGSIAAGTHPSIVNLAPANNGPVNMKSPNNAVTYKIYLSQNTTFGDADDIFIGANTQPLTMPAGEYEIVMLDAVARANFTIPSGLNGAYYVWAYAEHAPPSILCDTNLANNAYMRPGNITVTGAPSARPQAPASRATSATITNMYNLGGIGCAPVSADFDGDGRADVAVYQDSSGYWAYLSSSNAYERTLIPLGLPD